MLVLGRVRFHQETLPKTLPTGLALGVPKAPSLQVSLERGAAVVCKDVWLDIWLKQTAGRNRKISSLHLLPKNSLISTTNHKIFRAVENGVHFIQAHKRSPKPLKSSYSWHIFTPRVCSKILADINSISEPRRNIKENLFFGLDHYIYYPPGD